MHSNDLHTDEKKNWGYKKTRKNPNHHVLVLDVGVEVDELAVLNRTGTVGVIALDHALQGVLVHPREFLLQDRHCLVHGHSAGSVRVILDEPSDHFLFAGK